MRIRYRIIIEVLSRADKSLGNGWSNNKHDGRNVGPTHLHLDVVEFSVMCPIGVSEHEIGPGLSGCCGDPGREGSEILGLGHKAGTIPMTCAAQSATVLATMNCTDHINGPGLSFHRSLMINDVFTYSNRLRLRLHPGALGCTINRITPGLLFWDGPGSRF